jgi:hypothetical protein
MFRGSEVQRFRGSEVQRFRGSGFRGSGFRRSGSGSGFRVQRFRDSGSGSGEIEGGKAMEFGIGTRRRPIGRDFRLRIKIQSYAETRCRG